MSRLGRGRDGRKHLLPQRPLAHGAGDNDRPDQRDEPLDRLRPTALPRHPRDQLFGALREGRCENRLAAGVGAEGAPDGVREVFSELRGAAPGTGY